MSAKRMCPNHECPKFGEATGLMGGCDCGTALIPFKTGDELLREALWDLTPAPMKRAVTLAMIAQIHDERTKP